MCKSVMAEAQPSMGTYTVYYLLVGSLTVCYIFLRIPRTKHSISGHSILYAYMPFSVLRYVMMPFASSLLP